MGSAVRATATQGDPGEASDPQRSANRPMYSIGAVARMLGVEAGTLRAWEERYRIVVPERSQGSQRVYSRAQVEQLRFVMRSMDEGASAADAHRLLAERLDEPPEDTGDGQDDRLILVADRDRFFAEVSDYVLRTAGYAVVVASSPAEAERLHAERRPRLSVVELMMPGGLDLCRQLARDATSPVVGVSALALGDQALEAGASAFVQKPLDPPLLVAIVQDLLTSRLAARHDAAALP
jgi:CheY-like chemotaxis protein